VAVEANGHFGSAGRIRTRFGALFTNPQGLCRYESHLPEAVEDSPELWPRHKAHGSIRVQEGHPKAARPARSA
jgi:hypothetical protein